MLWLFGIIQSDFTSEPSSTSYVIPTKWKHLIIPPVLSKLWQVQKKKSSLLHFRRSLPSGGVEWVSFGEELACHSSRGSVVCLLFWQLLVAPFCGFPCLSSKKKTHFVHFALPVCVPLLFPHTSSSSCPGCDLPLPWYSYESVFFLYLISLKQTDWPRQFRSQDTGQAIWIIGLG